MFEQLNLSSQQPHLFQLTYEEANIKYSVTEKSKKLLAIQKQNSCKFLNINLMVHKSNDSHYKLMSNKFNLLNIFIKKKINKVLLN